jgi:hypothetical protein
MNPEDFNKELNPEANISLYEFELRCVRTGGLRGQWRWMDPVEPHRHTLKPSEAFDFKQLAAAYLFSILRK